MPDRDMLVDLLLETGMLQFGEFQQGGELRSFRFGLEMLPAYPDVLKRVAEYSIEVIEHLNVQRLVAVPEAIPFGTALSLSTGIPLIYSRGRGEDPAYDLVGAYDSGNRALVVCNVLIEPAPLVQLVQRARRVGLDVRGVLVVVGMEGLALPVDVDALLTLSTIGVSLVDSGKVPKRVAQSLLPR